MLKSGDFVEERKETSRKAMVIPDAFIKKIVVDKVAKVSGRYEVVLSVLGRSRFCYELVDPTDAFEYKVRTFYNDLDKIDKSLKKLLPKAYKKEEKALAFPEKSWFSPKKEKSQERLNQFSQYFANILATFSKADIVPEPLLDLCTPFPINILAIAENEANISKYLDSLILSIHNKDSTKETSEVTDQTMFAQPNSKKASINIGRQHKLYGDLFCPFDYLFGDRLFRLDFVNLHFDPRTPQTLLFGYSDCVLVIVDSKCKDWLPKLDKQFLAIASHNKTALTAIEVVVLAMDSEIQDEGELKRIRGCYEARFAGLPVKLGCTSYVPATGEGSINHINIILLHY